MPVKRELPAKIGRCSKNLAGRNFDFRAKSSWEKIFNIYKNFLSGGFRSKVKIVTAQLFATPPYFCWQLAFYRHLLTSIRERAIGGSRRRVKRSWWKALLMPPASRLTEFSTRKRVFFKTEFLFPPSVGNQDNLLMGRTVWSRLSTGRKPRSLPWGSFRLGGRVALPQCSVRWGRPSIGSEARDALDFGSWGGWRGFISVP